jgi:NADH-quinone oxidoreductase subunit F
LETEMQQEERYRALDQILNNREWYKKDIIPILQAIQDAYHYLPEDVLRRVCARTDITPAQLMGVAGFYAQFRLKPAGEHIIKVCTGTACHVKRADQVYDTFRRSLHLSPDADTDDAGKYTLEKVNCLGCCTLAPVVQIDEITYGHVDVERVKQVLNAFEHLNGGQAKKTRQPAVAGGHADGEIRIGLGSCCVASGSEAVRNSVEQAVKDIALDVRMKGVGCVGLCHQVPLLEVIPKGQGARLLFRRAARGCEKDSPAPFSAAGFLESDQEFAV